MEARNKRTAIQLNVNLTTGKSLALWKVSKERQRSQQHVFLTHGTFSSKKVCLVLAEYLAAQGYCCWILEWRNHGSSFRTNKSYTFETIAKEDIKVAWDYLIKEQGVKQWHAITHSGGGLCLTIALIAYPAYQAYFHSLTLFACQATGAANSIGKLLRLQLSKGLCKFLGYVPAKKIGGEYNEPYFFMKQWFDWNLNQKFSGSEQQNYQIAMSEISIPVLAVFGKGDTFIAPPKGCREFLSFFQNSQKEMLYGAKENGFAEDYTHSRIIHSRNAHQEIYPKVLAWIEEHTPLPS